MTTTNDRTAAIKRCLDEALERIRSGIGSALSNAMMVEAVYDAGVKAATPPKDHILDDTGTVRRLLGTLPLTADGCVAMLDAYVWNSDQWCNCAKVIYRRDSGYGAVFHTQWRPLECCYSTREAAEAARKETPHE